MVSNPHVVSKPMSPITTRKPLQVQDVPGEAEFLPEWPPRLSWPPTAAPTGTPTATPAPTSAPTASAAAQPGSWHRSLDHEPYQPVKNPRRGNVSPSIIIKQNFPQKNYLHICKWKKIKQGESISLYTGLYKYLCIFIIPLLSNISPIFFK